MCKSFVSTISINGIYVHDHAYEYFFLLAHISKKKKKIKIHFYLKLIAGD